MKTARNLSQISWKQVEKIIKDQEFLKNIKDLSEEELKESFKKFDIEPTDDEIREFRRCFTKVIDNNEDLNDPENIGKKLLDDDELSKTSGGSISSHILAVVIGAIGGCLLAGVPLGVALNNAKNSKLVSKAKQKFEELQGK